MAKKVVFDIDLAQDFLRCMTADFPEDGRANLESILQEMQRNPCALLCAGLKSATEDGDDSQSGFITGITIGINLCLAAQDGKEGERLRQVIDATVARQKAEKAAKLAKTPPPFNSSNQTSDNQSSAAQTTKPPQANTPDTDAIKSLEELEQKPGRTRTNGQKTARCTESHGF